MRRFFEALALTLGLLSIASLACAQESPKVRRVTFKDGRAILRGVIKGYAAQDYVFPAGAGESIAIRLTSAKAYFNLNPPGSDEAVFNGSVSGNAFEGAAASSGDYTIRVYLMRNEARRGASAPYALTVALGRKSATAPDGPDFADGLTGGPDNWEVTGVAPRDTLKIRATPSAKAAPVAEAPNGATLKNLGCRNARGQRWCRVEDAEKRSGWVNGRYLREGGSGL